jgi:prepilin-type processing-associated H-X9-DG protein
MDSSVYDYTPPGGVQHFSSYAGNRGTFYQATAALTDPTDPCFGQLIHANNGTIFNVSCLKLSAIRDGTSTTFLFGEHTAGGFPEENGYGFWWQSGWWTDTMFDTNYEINAPRKLQRLVYGPDYWWWVKYEAASSFHPGGANFAFADGSVRFIKETIANWEFDEGSFGDPVGVTFGSCGEYQMGTARPRVYQALSTRAGSEAIGSDEF